MSNSSERYFKPMFLTITFMLLLGLGLIESNAMEASLAKTIFYVSWYDVGKAALVGLDGVKKVKNGWRNFKEINTVYYDPSKVTIEEMEDALKKADTYQGRAETAKWSEFPANSAFSGCHE